MRNQADREFKHLNETQWRELRHRAKHDRFFLGKGVLRYKKLAPLHKHLCNWLETYENERFKEILLPRGHYKSTVITVTGGIQSALTDDSGSAVWPYSLGPDILNLIGHEVKESAQKFLLEITGHFLSNKMLMWLFPELVPDKNKHRINLSELELPREVISKQATFSTMGTGGRSQGAHFNNLILDDLIGDKARDSKTEMEAAKSWFNNIQSFFSSFTEDHLTIVGTRWSVDDLYDHIHEMYGTELAKYIRPAEEIVDGKLVPIFPEQFTTRSFEILKKDRRVWSAQYANDPTAGATLLDKHWKKFYRFDGYNRIFYNKKSYDVEEMHRCILIDPAMSGKAGFVVTGMTHDGYIFTLDALKDEWRPPDLVDLIFKAVDRWQPHLVGIEKVLFSGLFAHWLPDQMILRGKRFRIEQIATGGKAKEARVLGLSSYFAAGQIIFHPNQTNIISEFDNFGASDDYHILDALAQGPEVWRKGVRHDWLEEKQKAYDAVLQGRHPIGGY